MQITSLEFIPPSRGTLRGYADVTFDNCLSIREFRLLRTRTGYMLHIPNIRQKHKSLRTVAYPSDHKTLKVIEDAVIAEYKKVTRASNYPRFD
jgi:DNA-binding cell septation regulator SpoVG